MTHVPFAIASPSPVLGGLAVHPQLLAALSNRHPFLETVVVVVAFVMAVSVLFAAGWRARQAGRRGR